MRDIKFRGKVKYNGNHLHSGDWVYGSYILKYACSFIYVIEEDEFGNIVREFEVEVIPETVGQYTGMKDKNGVEIYENCEINNKYIVVYKFNKYILQRISSRDIFKEIKDDEEYEITREYIFLKNNSRPIV